ncbi:MAG: anaerobic ribonucleoside-triphosphate reductase activating protein [Kiritimatiellae bacterium]|nr:anaerobic ribonucleoside-triphosphate reductase activating protein [Kiritimatiellia bacterium]
MTIDVAGITQDSITDGPGLRFVLFVQGCPHHCPGCQNPQTHQFGVGEKLDVAEVYRQIKLNPLNRSVTFSGGEPFSQPAPLAVLAKRLRAEGYDLAAYSGFTFEELLAHPDPAVRDFLEQLNVLVDGRFVLARRNLELLFRGSDNQRILNVPASLRTGTAIWSTDPDWVGWPEAGVGLTG